jgi:hypothetical protein
MINQIIFYFKWKEKRVQFEIATSTTTKAVTLGKNWQKMCYNSEAQNYPS